MAKKEFTPYPRDEKAFHLLSSVGKCELRDLRRIGGVKEGRVTTYIRQGFVEKYKDAKAGKNLYRYTDKGREYVRKNYGYNPYSAGQTSWRHDEGLRDKYKDIPEECRPSIMTENDVKDWVRTYIREEKASGDYARVQRAIDIEDRWSKEELSCPDMAWINPQGQLVFTEVITDYPKRVIEAKMAMAVEFGAIFDGIRK